MFNHPPASEPRASRILIPGRSDLTTELWMGGANSLHGELLVPDELCDAWLIDLAGEMPDEHRSACAHWLPRVFADIEAVPQHYDRLDALARSLAACMSGDTRADRWPHPHEPPRRLYVQCCTENRAGMGGRVTEWDHPTAAPARLYVMCSQGLNRSGLVAGLVLRALGMSGAEAVAAISSRPGALSNITYVRLIHEWPHIAAATG